MPDQVTTNFRSLWDEDQWSDIADRMKRRKLGLRVIRVAAEGGSPYVAAQEDAPAGRLPLRTRLMSRFIY